MQKPRLPQRPAAYAPARRAGGPAKQRHLPRPAAQRHVRGGQGPAGAVPGSRAAVPRLPHGYAVQEGARGRHPRRGRAEIARGHRAADQAGRAGRPGQVSARTSRCARSPSRRRSPSWRSRSCWPRPCGLACSPPSEAGAQVAQMPMIAPIAEAVMQGAGYTERRHGGPVAQSYCAAQGTVAQGARRGCVVAHAGDTQDSPPGQCRRIQEQGAEGRLCAVRHRAHVSPGRFRPPHRSAACTPRAAPEAAS